MSKMATERLAAVAVEVSVAKEAASEDREVDLEVKEVASAVDVEASEAVSTDLGSNLRTTTITTVVAEIMNKKNAL